MVSQLKSDTARINGAKSRGPTTDEGKEKSSRNSLKHGLTATSGKILLDCEDPHQFDEVLNKFHNIHEPATAAEKDIVGEMVAARWRIRRMWTIETGLLNAEILAQAAKTDTRDPDIHLASAFRSLTDDSRSLALASRYEARLQRLYDRAYKTLRELQQARKSQEPTPPPHTVHIRWVSPNEAPDQPGESAPETGLRNEPTVAEPVPAPQAFVPVFRKAEPAAPEAGLRNEPTVDEKKEVAAQPSGPAVRHDDPENENTEQPHNPREDAALNQPPL